MVASVSLICRLHRQAWNPGFILNMAAKPLSRATGLKVLTPKWEWLLSTA
jgi:hypothetical protein